MNTAHYRTATLQRISDSVHPREGDYFDMPLEAPPVFPASEKTTPPPLPDAEEPIADDPRTIGLFGLVDLILKGGARLERLIRRPDAQLVLLPRFLAIALLGFVFFGVAVSLVFTLAGEWPRVASPLSVAERAVAKEMASLARFEPLDPRFGRLGPWLDGSAARLIAAYALGLVAATGICLPSLYFYGLLAGIRMSMLDVVMQSLKAKATAAVSLVGILPIYASLGLGMAIFDVPQPYRLTTYWLGLILPFLAGGFGTWSLYRGLSGFADTLSADRRCRRACFLRRLVVSWAACYTAVTPLMIHTLWHALSQ